MTDKSPTRCSLSKGASASDDAAELETLLAEALEKYSLKDYPAATDLYSRAAELQANIHGEMSTENADILYLYGKCLYHLAVSKSDVLGTKVANETAGPQQRAHQKNTEDHKDKDKAPSKAITHTTSQDQHLNINEAAAASTTPATSGLFQFTGDENFDTSDEDQDDEDDDDDGSVSGNPAQKEEPDDDFANAFEVLDLARVLLLRKLDAAAQSQENGSSKGKAPSPKDMPPQLKQLKERLADVYDLQAEISLEGELFPAAVEDLRSALKLREELYPPESEMLAEVHYKLSLALEFASVTQQSDDDTSSKRKENVQPVDIKMREEAASEMSAAISSCRLRISMEHEKLKTISDPLEKKTVISRISDVKSLVQDLEQRLKELQDPLVPSTRGLGEMDLLESVNKNSLLGNLISQGIEGKEKEEAIEKAVGGARDLSGLVRKKTKTPSALPATANEKTTRDDGKHTQTAKRKADNGENAAARTPAGKKARHVRE